MLYFTFVTSLDLQQIKTSAFHLRTKWGGWNLCVLKNWINEIMSFLHSVGVKCNQGISFGIWKTVQLSFRDVVLPQTDWFPIMKVSLNLVGLGFYTSFHVSFFSPLRYPPSKSMLLPVELYFFKFKFLWFCSVLCY